MKKERVLVTGGTKEDVAPIATFVINVKKINPDFCDEIIIFHNGISKKDQERMKKIFPIRFIRYRYPGHKFKLLLNNTIRYFSPMIFCKYECIRLLKEYKQVIWSDYDVLIQKKINELHQCNQVPLYAPVTVDSPLKDMFNCDVNDIVEGYDLNAESVTTPIFVLNDIKLDVDKTCEWCYQKTEQYSKYLYLPEQCIFTMLIQKYKISYEPLSNQQYVCEAKEAREEASIIHAAGQPKFWNGLENEVWKQNYKEWLDIGGTSYKQYRKSTFSRWIN